MLIDKSFDMSEAQAVTVSAASTNVIDMGRSGKRALNPFYAVCQVREAATAAGDATVTIKIETSDKEDFSSDTETVFTTAAMAKASLVKDKTLFKADIGGVTLKRYVRGYYTVATGPLTAGRFDLFCAGAVDAH